MPIVAYKLFKYLLFVPVLRTLWRPWTEGLDNVPRHGGVLLAANHIGIAETILIPLQCPRQLVFPVKAEMFTGRSLGQRIVAWFLRAVGMVPMDRTGGRASADAMHAVEEVLRSGGALSIFPEGTRSPDGRLYKGRTGVARLALATGAVVVPVGVSNTEAPKNNRLGALGLLNVRRPGVIFGKPLDFSEFADRPADRRVLRHVTDEIMTRIQELTGQTYVEVYASSVKAGQYDAAELDERVRTRPGSGIAPAPLPTANSLPAIDAGAASTAASANGSKP
ncbi:1-acyl-sn-glycerol-3-phosphate acyltransferase [Naumannella halotolerans]|uniref:1-acyl-sn-glycerol-3-phosphate acyltransferase n=1 Tax=Naumannella halotolerans TaxID=993414 RepID=A0A4R7J5Y0_9ACTN|nr:1-acyl-sn-glycerol-3-phosphate acyltransferase [Naumannella halotolerans]